MGFGIWSLSRQLAPELISELESPEAAAMAVIPEKGIAVLPFENLSEDQQNAFLADGVQDDIRTTLAKVADLKVINRTSVNTYPAGTQRNMRRMAQTLGVAYALEGSVRQTGENVSITVQLIDARTGVAAWKKNYDGDLGDVFEIQRDIVLQIMSQLKARFRRKKKRRLTSVRPRIWSPMAFTFVPRRSSRRFLSIPKSTKSCKRRFSWPIKPSRGTPISFSLTAN